MSRVFEHDPFIHPPLAAEQRERLRAEGASGPSEREMSFDQFLDAINPLHHIPVVGTVYRALTGDTIDSAASVVGSVIYGGPVGLIAGLVNAVVEESSGSNLGGHALAMVTGEEPAAAPDPASGQELAQEAQQAAQPSPASSSDAVAAPPASTPRARPSPEDALPPDSSSDLVLEGDDALAALAADLRAAVAGDGSRRQGAAGRIEAEAAARELETPSAGSGVPPRESFMPLTATAFNGPSLATDIKAEHAHRPGATGSGGLFPASLSAAAGRADAQPEADASEQGGPGNGTPENGTPENGAERQAAADFRTPGLVAPGLVAPGLIAPGLIAPGLQADPRFAAQVAPETHFAERMTEALNKYQALSGGR